MSDKRLLIQVSSTPNCKVLEIGVAQGKTMIELLQSNPTLQYVGIDPWKFFEGLNKPPHGLVDLNSQEDIEKWYEKVLKGLEEFEGRGKVIRGFSKDVLLNLTETFDVIHIDGDHTYEGCKWDIDNSLHLLKEGGSIVVDDVHYWEGCTRAWKESKEQYKEINIWPK